MTYILPSKVNIRNIKDIHADILTYLNSNEAVEIDLDSCEYSDLSLVQLLESARKTADTDGKSLVLTKPAP